MELKLILTDSSQIILSNESFINKFSIICSTKEQAFYFWQKLNPANTSQVKVMLDNKVIQIISNMIVDGLQIHEDSDNNQYIVTFSYYGASYSRDIEKENNDVARILLGEE